MSAQIRSSSGQSEMDCVLWEMGLTREGKFLIEGERAKIDNFRQSLTIEQLDTLCSALQACVQSVIIDLHGGLQ